MDWGSNKQSATQLNLFSQKETHIHSPHVVLRVTDQILIQILRFFFWEDDWWLAYVFVSVFFDSMSFHYSSSSLVMMFIPTCGGLKSRWISALIAMSRQMRWLRIFDGMFVFF